MNTETSSITDQDLLRVAHNIASFYEFTFFGERNITESAALVFIVEYQAVQLGIVGKSDEVEADEEVISLHAFVSRLDKIAKENKVSNWKYISVDLPYLD